MKSLSLFRMFSNVGLLCAFVLQQLLISLNTGLGQIGGLFKRPPLMTKFIASLFVIPVYGMDPNDMISQNVIP